ncbi:hypothetical protein [Parabacteroides sp. PF5-9]|uniref:hypothetical protein n=1 Tax=Parabacteroides sp. PF5-9 TaxID=1742404 RepID=UPI002476ACBC|nr:hypothetical protein [Parabacteroides sp. PF5-9]MDH6358022.1 hypothetical protein [Parabacteroides sp. PF5-9]
MEGSIMIAVIAALSAIAGGAIQGYFSYLLNKQKNKYDRLRELDNKQKEIYWDFWYSMQVFMNHNTDREAFEAFQINVTRLALYADNSTSKIVQEYFQTLINQNNNKKSLSRESHTKYQTKIMNSMRMHLEMDGFDNFELIAFTPQNNIE